MMIYALKCCKCNYVIYSRAKHDYRTCTCRDAFVDGGPNAQFGRFGGSSTEPARVDVDATVEQLYDDWNKRQDEFGRISTTTVDLRQRILPSYEI